MLSSNCCCCCFCCYCYCLLKSHRDRETETERDADRDMVVILTFHHVDLLFRFSIKFVDTKLSLARGPWSVGVVYVI